MHGFKLRFGAILALVSAALFYLLALVAAAGLAWAGWEVGSFLPHIRGKGLIAVGIGALALFAAAAVVLWSIFPRAAKFVPPGPELDKAKHPKLFAEIERIGAATGQALPEHVYLLPEVNAFVTERGGVMGLFSKRVMGIGLPLLGNLTVAQLRSVLAHEFGHFAGGDVKLLPWINKARLAMLQTLHNLTSAGESANQGELAIASIVFWIVRAPFKAYAMLYLRLTQGLSRAQEIAADALAISICGSRVHEEALQLTERAGLAFRVFLSEDVEPLLATGRVPPIAAGFRSFLSVDKVRQALEAASREPRETDPYDSHPSLEERVTFAKARAVTVKPRLDDDAPAVELLSDLNGSELELVKFVTELESLERVSWEDSGRHLVELWKRELPNAKLFDGLAVKDLPRTSRELREQMKGRHVEDEEQLMRQADREAWLRLSVLLHEAGFRVVNAPGENLRFVRGDEALDLSETLRAFRGKDGSREAWVATWQALGLADRMLSTGQVPA